MMSEREASIDTRMIRVARANPIGNDHAVARVYQRPDEVAVKKAPRRIAMQEQHWSRIRVSFVDIRHRMAVDTERLLLPTEQVLEPVRLFIHRKSRWRTCISAALFGSGGRPHPLLTPCSDDICEAPQGTNRNSKGRDSRRDASFTPDMLQGSPVSSPREDGPVQPSLPEHSS